MPQLIFHGFLAGKSLFIDAISQSVNSNVNSPNTIILPEAEYTHVCITWDALIIVKGKINVLLCLYFSHKLVWVFLILKIIIFQAISVIFCIASSCFFSASGIRLVNFTAYKIKIWYTAPQVILALPWPFSSHVLCENGR